MMASLSHSRSGSSLTSNWLLLALIIVIYTGGNKQQHAVQARNYALPSICLQPPPRSEGLCTIEIEGYYFDLHTNDCRPYTVGGCRSSPGQSFGDIHDCIATCMRGTRHIQDLYINE